jgi:hypothetical protein
MGDALNSTPPLCICRDGAKAASPSRRAGGTLPPHSKGAQYGVRWQVPTAKRVRDATPLSLATAALAP